MIFFNPDALWLFAVFPLVLVLIVLEYFQGKRSLAAVLPGSDLPRVLPVFAAKWFLASICLLVALAALVLALAEPAWGEEYVEEQRSDLDIMLVLDVSRSMQCTDVKPDRLSRAKESLRSLLRQLPEGRVGLVIVRGGASVAVPLTMDRPTIDRALALVSTDSVSSPGTGLAKGLELAMDAFPGRNPHNRFIVLASDGGDDDPELIKQGRRASEQGMPVICLGIGTEAGSSVPGVEGPVLSRLNTAQLQELARVSRGEWLEPDAVFRYKQIATTIAGLKERLDTQGFRIRDVRRQEVFIAIALLALGLSLVIRTLRWRKLW